MHILHFPANQKHIYIEVDLEIEFQNFKEISYHHKLSLWTFEQPIGFTKNENEKESRKMQERFIHQDPFLYENDGY